VRCADEGVPAAWKRGERVRVIVLESNSNKVLESNGNKVLESNGFMVLESKRSWCRCVYRGVTAPWRRGGGRDRQE
jgi:hypothetical protein